MVPSVYIEDIVLFAGHIYISKGLTNICKAVPFTSFNLSYPFL